MIDLDLFAIACPDVEPLDDATRAQIHQAVFGRAIVDPHEADDVEAETIVALSPPPRRRVLLASAAVLIIGTVGGVAWATRHGSSRPTSVVPGTVTNQPPEPTQPPQPTQPTVASPSTTAVLIDDWREHPQRRFAMTMSYFRPANAARELVIRRCMQSLGFEYRLRPNFADMPTDGSTWPEGDAWDTWHHQQSVTVPGFKKAYFGPGDQGGGCLDQAYATIYGPVRAEVYAESIRGNAQGGWNRTALADPAVRAALETVAACVRAAGFTVTDATTNSEQAQEDIMHALDSETMNVPPLDPANVHDVSDLRAASRAAREKVCPTYGDYEDGLAEAARIATVTWIDAHPGVMADIQREVDDDITRFEWIITNDGNLPPS